MSFMSTPWEELTPKARAAWQKFMDFVMVALHAPVVNKLQDKAQPKRRDRSQLTRWAKKVWSTETKLYSKFARRYVVVVGPCDDRVYTPWSYDPFDYRNQMWDWAVGGFTNYGSGVISRVRTTDETRQLETRLGIKK